MINEYIQTGNLQWFVVFFLIIFFRWFVVFVNTFGYHAYKGNNASFFTSVIIPVVDEPEDIFQNVLNSIAKQIPNEIIIIINGPNNPKLMSVCQSIVEDNQYPDKMKIEYFYTPIAGKRHAIKFGLEKTSPKSELTILVDSDTFWTDNTLVELIKPFSEDACIGGVTTRQKIFNPNRNLVTRFANLLEEIRANGSMKAMSRLGKVGCLPGRTIAFRTSILRYVIDDFMKETFMGIHKEVSDDRSLTNLTLKLNYKCVLQETSVVYTDAPVTWKKFIRQQLRWSEGSQYNNLRMTYWMLKNAKLMFFIYWTDMLLPFLLIATYLNMVICYVLRRMNYPIQGISYSTTLLATISLIILGTIFSFGIRNIKFLSEQPIIYVLLLPFFIFILTIVMTPIRIIGLMRCADNHDWGTRKIHIGE